MSPKNFSLLGAAGYIAPRHFKAIKETNNTLVSLMDPSDSVGVIDGYFPSAKYFGEFEPFISDLYSRQKGPQQENVDFVSICSPNYLHASHIKLALEAGASAICEKPLVLTPHELDELSQVSNRNQKDVFSILQLRHHPALLELKHKLSASGDTNIDVELTYITSRGAWYFDSWKGNEGKSGGIIPNIGIHFFDMLAWLLGEVESVKIFKREFNKASGYLRFKRGQVKWYLSLDSNDLPTAVAEDGQRTFRSISFGGQELEFSGGFTDLHTVSYQQILRGGGFSIEESRPSIELAYALRKQPINELVGDYHHMLTGM